MNSLLPPSYLDLPDKFYKEARPDNVPDPKIVVYNDKLASELGLDLKDENFLSGNLILPGTIPVALGYAGHQFGHYTTLGDGRAILLGEHVSPDGKRWDIQLKGSGRTFFSRRGDGKATLGPMLREYLISEAMAALGIPTTRCLAVLTTGENISRFGMEPGAIVVRVASSHIRIGTFEFATDSEVEELSDFTISRHYSHLNNSNDKYIKFLDEIIKRQALLVAHWISVGFIHGVMNTDNVALSGETIDYGPCAFMNHYDPATVYSSIDKNGRYAFGNQPKIMQWNLARLAETLIPILADDKNKSVDIANELINLFPVYFNTALENKMKIKIGGALDSLKDLYQLMYENKLDYTNTFANLNPDKPHFNDSNFIEWHRYWSKQALTKPINNKVIPRNQHVEQALASAAIESDFKLFFDLLKVVQNPFDAPPLKYITSIEPDGFCTYCGT
jgi:uncharacterized protein YdiU (UPF0061 family)